MQKNDGQTKQNAPAPKTKCMAEDLSIGRHSRLSSRRSMKSGDELQFIQHHSAPATLGLRSRAVGLPHDPNGALRQIVEKTHSCSVDRAGG
jgi:hypothetical protein